MQNFLSIFDSDITTIAIGKFDGFHIGHQALLSHLDGSSALLVIENNAPKITPYRERYCALPILILELKEILNLHPFAFISLLRLHLPKLKNIVVGYDFRFGINALFDAWYLKFAFSPYGNVKIVPPVMIGDIILHKSEIKRLLHQVEIDFNFLKMALNRDYDIHSKIIRGQALGAKSLYPTINLDTEELFLPKEGIYAGIMELEIFQNGVKNVREFIAAVFVGRRSTDGANSVEAHILDTRGYELLEIGSFANIRFLGFIAAKNTIKDLKKLKVSIRQNIIDTVEYFASSGIISSTTSETILSRLDS